MAYAVAAWVVALSCVAVVWARLRRVQAIELPSARTLLSRLDAAASASAARAELDDWIAEVDRITSVGSELPRALSRVALASGTALAILALLRSAAAPAWAAVFGAFVAGMVGAMGTGLVGRVAEQRARRAREHWSAETRRVWAKLHPQS